jgi:transcriptional regulator with XRE-family HTH domain
VPGTLGETLATARSHKGWSLREVERRTGIHNAHLSQIETGAIERPAPNVLWTLAEVYDLDFQSLLRLAGHVERAAVKPGTLVGAALRSMGDLSEDEQREVLGFMEKLKQAKRDKP